MAIWGSLLVLLLALKCTFTDTVSIICLLIKSHFILEDNGLMWLTSGDCSALPKSNREKLSSFALGWYHHYQIASNIDYLHFSLGHIDDLFTSGWIRCFLGDFLLSITEHQIQMVVIRH